ncbi:PREDICTED: RING finger and transmembrane domain-containing protein 2 isoform X2 [Tarenaya hassleriana]|uniref:RING finger and transmembrane domain-containing protein 2 isoform X2 n=1 Tax=Tarenaya hassleriana TaxID=28532 RepID=UPI0008FD0031|nr:PREDICTED: RING finger and transmembrane domain-containing protein 2 isoform X2 [Tarenaya hassleriana]
MESSAINTENSRRGSLSSENSRRYSILSASNIIQAPISTLLEYSGLLRTRAGPLGQEAEILIHDGLQNQSRLDDSAASSNGEVAIRIIGSGEQETDGESSVREATGHRQGEVSVHQIDGLVSENHGDRGAVVTAEGLSQASPISVGDSEAGDAIGSDSRDSPYQRYDIQQAARWIEQVLPFSLLLLVVFIRQHLQGFFVTIWIAGVLFKSNDILKKQTSLKGERQISALIGISVAFTAHAIGVYWWFWEDDLLFPLIMLPPKSIPPFWHAIFIIVVNDTLVRQAAMVLKCFLLMYYKNSRGRNYRKQGQMLTLVEYLMLLYRSLLPTPVWYRFFLNKEYGSLFSSLMTGLYLTFKLTSVVEKVQSFFTALKALSRKEVHYGSYATAEQLYR